VIALVKRLLGDDKGQIVLRLSSFVVFIFIWLSAGVRLEGDSGSYIDGSILRSPLYPLIIKLFSSIDGSLYLLILFQLLLGLYAIHIFLGALRKIFDFDIIIQTLVLAFIALPYYFITVNQRFFIGNLIMTESICYPLYLLASAAIIRAVIEQRLKFYLHFVLLMALLILTRRQFLFLYPFFAIVWLALFIQKEKIPFSRFVLLGIFILSIIATNMLERTYQYVRHDRFTTIPFTGRQLLVIPMFVAREDDKDLFNDEERRDIFSLVYKYMADEDIAFSELGSISLNVYSAYERHYNHISHYLIPGSAQAVLGDRYDEYAMDEHAVKISLALMKRHFKDYLRVYLKNIEVNSGRKAIVFFFFFLFVLTLINYIRLRSKVLLILLFAFIMQLGNYMLIALVEPIVWRYTVYTSQVMFVLIALCAVCGQRTEISEP
jgi:hypothetical protein